MYNKKAGILLPISSLPSNYGIGSFGKSAYDFIDFLNNTKQSYWQILPLNSTSYGDSPYQSNASFAGNIYFIDLELLYEEGLLKKKELDENINIKARIDYEWLYKTRINILKKAFSRFKKNKEFIKFILDNDYWLNDYAKFMCLKEINNNVVWQKFTNFNINEENFEFWYFVQYKFDIQWKNILRYAHSKNIQIIGDMPIYVALDSADVYFNKEIFLLDENNYPRYVAGCAPDAFTKEGQLWGNPLYDWNYLEKTNFSWWIKRFKRHLYLYDVIRIDHFRGFAGFYKIPFKETTAINGTWEKALGSQLFKIIKDIYKDIPIIAEDLGYITPDVENLLKETNFPGMKILQFAFYNESDLKKFKTSNNNYVVYTGSHDSDCTLTWLKNLDNNSFKLLKKECLDNSHYKGVYALIEYALKTDFILAIIPIQDYLELSNEEGRINIPSTKTSNWTFKLKKDYITSDLVNKVKKLIIDTNR